MITYAYWLGVFALTLAVLGIAGVKLGRWKIGVGLGVSVLLVGWMAYTFHFQQLFVKRWGGVMSIRVPQGQVHLTATWKDDHLWIENYDPATNTCHFSEYSKGNLLEGKVTIKDCNPLAASRGDARLRSSRP
ncbi:MAG: hypothetical protein GY723_01295 [bacterium]|nr:hypothetical protein [bacterium]MCP5069972.1 hypothetical protein [bacterium]